MELISVSLGTKRLSHTIHSPSETSRAMFSYLRRRVRVSRGCSGRRRMMTRAVEEQSGNAARHAAPAKSRPRLSFRWNFHELRKRYVTRT